MDGYTEEKKRKFTFGRLIKILILVASAAVYLIFFARFFVSCESEIADDLFLDRDTAELFQDLDTDLPFYHYQPVSWTNEDGSVQITNIFYIEKTGDLQLTVRSRDDIFDKKSGEYPFSFKIRVSGEDESETEAVPTMRVQERHGYTYARLAVDGIVSDHGEMVEIELETYDEEGNSHITTDTEIKGGTEVWLDIFDSETGTKLHTFEIAGKRVNRARVRRSTVDVVIVD